MKKTIQTISKTLALFKLVPIALCLMPVFAPARADDSSRPGNFANAVEKPIRLAIIGNAAECGKEMDILTVELSGKSGYDLIERKELDKIFSEQKISLQNLYDPEYSVKAGKLSKADVFISLSKLKELKGKIRLSAIDSETGILLKDHFYDLEEASFITDITKGVEDSLRIRANLGEKVKGLSILPFRPSEPGDFLQSSAEGLRGILSSRINESQEIVLLDRKHMEAILRESAISVEWRDRLKASTYILDGTIERGKGNTLTLNITLKKIIGKDPIKFKIQGERKELAEVSEKILKKLQDSLKMDFGTVNTDRKTESAILVAKARMYTGFKEYEKAIECAQAAIALNPGNVRYMNLLAEILDWQLVYAFGRGKDPVNFEKAGLRLLEFCRNPKVTFDPFFIANNKLSPEMRKNYRLLRSERLQRAEKSGNRRKYCREVRLMVFYDDKIFDSFYGKINARKEWLKCFREELKNPKSKSMQELSGAHNLMLKDDIGKLSSSEKEEWIGFCRELQKIENTDVSLSGFFGEMCASDVETQQKLFDKHLRDYGFHPEKSKEMSENQEIQAVFKQAFQLLPADYSDSLLKTAFEEFMNKPDVKFLKNRGWIITEYISEALTFNYNKTTDKTKRNKNVKQWLMLANKTLDKISSLPEGKERDKYCSILREEINSNKAYHGEIMAENNLWDSATRLFYLPDEMEKAGQAGRWRIRASVLQNNKLFLYIRKKSSMIVGAAYYDLNNQKFHFLGKRDMKDCHKTDIEYDVCIAGSKNVVYVAGVDTGLMVFPLNGKKPYVISEKDGLPGTTVTALGWNKDRLFMGIGRSYEGYGSLCTYDPVKKEFEIIASSRRNDKSRILDKNIPYEITSISPESNGKTLLFTLMAPRGKLNGLWQITKTNGKWEYKQAWRPADREFAPYKFYQLDESFYIHGDKSSLGQAFVEFDKTKGNSRLVYLENDYTGMPPIKGKPLFPQEGTGTLEVSVQSYALFNNRIWATASGSLSELDKDGTLNIHKRPDTYARCITNLITYKNELITVWENQAWLIKK